MRTLRLLVLGALVSTSVPAWSAPRDSRPGPSPEPDDRDPDPPLVPPASDTLGGHFVAGASAGLLAAGGNLEQGAPAGDLATGLGLGLDLGYGISRFVVLGVWGQYALNPKTSDCGGKEDSASIRGCGATGFAVGPFVRYHLVQGMRFDPWLMAGLGYRVMTVDVPARGKAPDPVLPARKDDYSGVEWLKLAIGGDYYPTKYFGFGPLLELDAGVFGKHADSTRDSAVHFSFVLGLRVVLDVPGK